MSVHLPSRLAGEGDPLLTTFVIVPRVEIVEALAAAGFDGVIIDGEHGPIGAEALPALIAAARGAGMTALVRVADHRAAGIAAALDAGAEGVLVPHVASSDDARAIVEAGRFPPLGLRSANPWVRAARYGADATFFESANGNTAILAMVEGQEGVSGLDDILPVEGLDGVFVGPVDLSSALGIAGDTEHPRVVALVAEIVGRATAAERAAAVFASTPRAADRWFDAGARLVALGVDAGMMLAGFRRSAEGVKRASPLGGTLTTKRPEP